MGIVADLGRRLATLRAERHLTQAVLARDDWRVFMSVFCTTDRVQHMMYRFWDTEHPEYDAAIANREMTFFGKTMTPSEAIPSISEPMDRVIGEAPATRTWLSRHERGRREPGAVPPVPDAASAADPPVAVPREDTP